MLPEKLNITAAPATLLAACLQENRVINGPASLSPNGMFSKGRRNTDMTSLAGLFRSKGASAEEIEAALTVLNQTITDPLDQSEVSRISQSIARYDVAPDGFTHDSFACLLVKKFDGKVLYCLGRGFYCYDGKRWAQDPEGLQIMEIARALANDICADIERVKTSCDPDSFAKLKKAGVKTKSADFLSKSIKLTKADPQIRMSYKEFDQHKKLINAMNGTYDLLTGELKPYDPKDLLTHLLNIDYDPAAECPKFEAFLTDILSEEQVGLILRTIGYSLLGHGREQMFFIFHGKGRNGKSTLIGLLENILDELLITIQPQSLNGKMDGAIRNDLARLPDKRIMITSETKAGSILDAPLLKQITGQDTIAVRFLHQEYFEFQPVCVPIIVTNHLPVIDGADFAIGRRVCLISFNKTVPSPDKSLGEKLLAERSGILNLILGGLAEYQKTGLAIPPSVQAETKVFVERSNLMKGFFQDCLQTAPDGQLPAGQLYLTYSRWCWENGYKPLSVNLFKDAFERETGLQQERNSQGRFWPTLRLKGVAPITK